MIFLDVGNQLIAGYPKLALSQDSLNLFRLLYVIGDLRPLSVSESTSRRTFDGYY